jgi:hypothetical protein
MSKPISHEEVVIWFNVHNLNYEKIELYGDFFKSLNQIIADTYLGDDGSETRIEMSEEDKSSHFDWCWNKLINDQRKENFIFKTEGQHKDYFKNFFKDTFYGDRERKVKDSIRNFLDDVFNLDTNFTKSDLEILTEIYNLMEKNIE